ncbi:MAG: DNA replication/repair protein RecF [Gammaproteobacteria bacterium]|nr:DNA replication/repair protein RecF [Gammaproteobacteria bacterium]
MTLVRIKIRNLRNILSLDLAPGHGINVVLGPNASGKSSLLEAIHLLSSGRSFRTHHLAQVVQRETSEMVISAEVFSEASGTRALGMEFDMDRGRLRMKAAGKPVQRLSELAPFLPVVTIHQESHRVFTLGPEFRRSFMDWGVFHVEPRFLPAWQRYRRALKQRNSILQQALPRPEVWDRELVENGVLMDAYRRRYLEQFIARFRGLLPMLRIDSAIDLKYRSGWASDADLAVQLAKGLEGDRRSGYTRIGPHRADIEFVTGGIPVRECLSRGQMKVLVYALYLAQACTLAEITGGRGLILIDDLAAELDAQHIEQLILKISALGFQTIVTSSDPEFRRHVVRVDHKMFHVEHGVFTEVI